MNMGYDNFADPVPKIGYYGNVPWMIRKKRQIDYMQSYIHELWKCVKIGLLFCGSY